MLVQQKSSELVFKADTNKWEGLTRSLDLLSKQKQVGTSSVGSGTHRASIYWNVLLV